MSVFSFYTTKEIRPEGWLKDQLMIQAKGLAGNLDKVWRDVRDSKWIGGDAEGWERVPYWLDGFIPLAYLLDDEDMKGRAKKYIDAILKGQCEDGWICPCAPEERDNYDMWALFLILKVLVLYHDCTGDERIEDAVYRALKQYSYFLRGHTPAQWAAARWFECIISIAWLYERRKEAWLPELAKRLEIHGIDYFGAAEIFANQYDGWTFVTHIVNMGMMLKADAVMSDIDGRDPTKRIKKLISVLQKSHGNINGFFNGDECLSGTAANRGTELCGVVEAMYSYEILAKHSEEVKWMDMCEKLAFNAYPATVSEDMWTHQYDQLSNQPCAVKLKNRHFLTNGSESHLFGLEPNYGRCTANMGQAFPKFALSAFMRSEKGVAVVSPVPARLLTVINGVKTEIKTDSMYPFRNTVKINIKAESPVEFELKIRIPSFYKKAFVDGKQVPVGKYYSVTKVFGEDTVELVLEAAPKYVKRGDLYGVTCGALTYTLPVKARWDMREYTRNNVERKFPFCDYELYPESEWQYGFADKKLTYGECDVYDCAFSAEHPLCFIETKVARIDWGYISDEDMIANAVPNSTEIKGEPETVRLVPFGCAKLRMTELPKL